MLQDSNQLRGKRTTKKFTDTTIQKFQVNKIF